MYVCSGSGGSSGGVSYTGTGGPTGTQDALTLAVIMWPLITFGGGA